MKSPKTSLMKKLDDVWKVVIKERDGYKCQVCGRTDTLNSHHIIGKRNKVTRWEMDNGICLCTSHHVFGLKSAHQSPIWFAEWLKEARPVEYGHLKEIENNYIKWTVESLQSKLDELTNGQRDTND